jgi:hypothetical protein
LWPAGVVGPESPWGLPFHSGVMVNRLPTSKPPTTCACCGEPFKVHNNHVYAWRSIGGR